MLKGMPLKSFNTKAIINIGTTTISYTSFQNMAGCINMINGVSLKVFECFFYKSYEVRAVNIQNVGDVDIQKNCFSLCSINSSNQQIFGYTILNDYSSKTTVSDISFIRCCGPFQNNKDRYVTAFRYTSLNQDRCNFSLNAVYIGPGGLSYHLTINSFSYCIYDNLRCDNTINNFDTVEVNQNVHNLVYSCNNMESRINNNLGCMIICESSIITFADCIFVENNATTLIRNNSEQENFIIKFLNPLFTKNLSTIGYVSYENSSYTTYEDKIYVGETFMCNLHKSCAHQFMHINGLLAIPFVNIVSL